jgi:hypothetical protein
MKLTRTIGRLLGTLLSTVLASFALQAQAASVTATLTADNHYGLYFGDADGSNLTLVGRNEVGSAGSAGSFNWSVAETWNFNVNAGQYLYVLAWNDGGPQSWIGQFATSSTTLVTNTQNWVYTAGGANPGESGPLPATSSVASLINTANWASVATQAANGTGPWGTIAGVGAANFIWSDSFNPNANNNYVIFRSADPIVAVPEPETILMLSAGLLLLATRKKLRA